MTRRSRSNDRTSEESDRERKRRKKAKRRHRHGHNEYDEDHASKESDRERGRRKKAKKRHRHGHNKDDEDQAKKRHRHGHNKDDEDHAKKRHRHGHNKDDEDHAKKRPSANELVPPVEPQPFARVQDEPVVQPFSRLMSTRSSLHPPPRRVWTRENRVPPPPLMSRPSLYVVPPPPLPSGPSLYAVPPPPPPLDPSPCSAPSLAPGRTQLLTATTPVLDSPAKRMEEASESPSPPSSEPVEPIARASFDSKDVEDGSLRVGNLSEYKHLYKVGQGTFGKVYKARRGTDGQEVALKRIQLKGHEDALPITSVREMRALAHLRHENIIEFYELAKGKTADGGTAICLVLEYAAHDLFTLMRRIQVDYNQAALLFKQLMLALDHCHRRHLLHRDLKTSNILISASGQLKLADFGLCQLYDENEVRKWTNPVITINYRPLELLLGSRNYGPEVDVWSAGCILAELLVFNPRKRQPVFFEGRREAEVIKSIEHLCGSVSLQEWPEVVDLPHYYWISERPMVRRQLREQFHRFDAGLVDLLDQLLQLHPARRPSAAMALQNTWLTSASSRATPLKLPDDECHELLARAGWINNRRPGKRERPASEDRTGAGGIADERARRSSY